MSNPTRLSRDRKSSNSHSYAALSNKKRRAACLGSKMQKSEILDRIWWVVRYKKLFTLIEVVVIAEVKRETARWYLKQLRAAGIVKPSAEAGPGVEWTLLKDPGPKRPYTGKGDRNNANFQRTDG